MQVGTGIQAEADTGREAASGVKESGRVFAEISETGTGEANCLKPRMTLL